MLAQSQQRAFWTQAIVQPFPLWTADRTEQDRIRLTRRGQRFGRQGAAGSIDGDAADQRLAHGEGVSPSFADDVEDANGLRDDFGTDPVTREDSNGSAHVRKLLVP